MTSDKPTKSERIAALEARIALLETLVTTLQAQPPGGYHVPWWQQPGLGTWTWPGTITNYC